MILRTCIICASILFCQGLHGQESVSIQGKLGIGIDAPTLPLYIQADQDQSAIGVKVGNTVRFLLNGNGGLSIGSSSTPAPNGLFVLGDAGIGISQPEAKLHIRSVGSGSNPQLLLYEFTFNDYARLSFQNASGDSKWTIAGKTSETNEEAELNFFNSGFDGNVMSLQGDGKVAIGTTSPDARLHIKSNGTGNNPQLLLFENSSTDYARLSFKNTSGDSRWSISGKTSNTNSNAELNFFNSGLGGDVMSLRGDGKVGIGTTSPDAQVHIESDGSGSTPQLLLLEDNSSDYARLNFKNTSGDSHWSIAGKTSSTNSDAELNFFNSAFGGNVMSLRGDGQVAIGTNNPTDKLHVNSDEGESALRVQLDGATKLRVHSNGGVSLLGNTTPDTNSLVIELGSSDFKITRNSNGTNHWFYPTVAGGGELGRLGEPWGWVRANILQGVLLPPSDRRYKENIKSIKNALDILHEFDPKTYAFTEQFYYEQKGNEWNETTRKKQYGFIAQDVEKHMPEIVHTDKDGYKSINYTALIPILTQAVNELQADNNDLRKLIEDQQAQLNNLTSQVQELKM